LRVVKSVMGRDTSRAAIWLEAKRRGIEEVEDADIDWALERVMYPEKFKKTKQGYGWR